MGQEQGTTPSAHTSTVPFYVVAIHGGAGFHPPPSESIKRSLREAIFSASTALSSAASTTARRSSYTPDTDPSALYTVTTLIAALEDAPDFNAGYGSNLTFDGNVECDAALMDGGCRRAGNDSGDGTFDAFGGVGAVRGIRNPVLLARRVLEGRRRRPHSGDRLGLGRIPPLLLVGEGAVQFAREQGGMNIVDPGEMVAPKAWQEWRVWRERWEDEQRVVAGRSSSGTSELVASAHDLRGGFVSDSNPWKLRGYDEPLSEDKNAELMRLRQDTVGAVVLMGDTGDVAAGVSSGGLLLKPSGRVGEAAVFGAGCWAEQLSGGRSVACSVSGQGELIMQSSLAKTLAEKIAATPNGDTHDILRSVLIDEFYRKWHPRGEGQPAVGVLLLTQGMDGDTGSVRLWCAFTTQSMAVGYASSRHPKPKATVLRNTTHDFGKEDGHPPLFITTLSC